MLLPKQVREETRKPMENAKPYPHEYFVTVRGRASGELVTTPFADERTAAEYLETMRDDPHFVLESPASFPWHVTFFVVPHEKEMSAKFNMVEGASEFVEFADKRPDLVVIEYNFVHSV